jgi:hypothetical protein
MHPSTQQGPGRAPDLIRWGPVVAGAAIGLGVFALLSTLWLAIAAGAGDDPVEAYLPWFLGATAAFALLLAGIIAGLFAGARGRLAGLANGITAWGLLFVLSLTAVVPGAANLTTGFGTGLGQGEARVGGAVGGVSAETALWAGFWSLLVGLLLAAVGGLLGGVVRRPVQLAEARSQVDEDARPAHDDGAANTDPRLPMDGAADADRSGGATAGVRVPGQRDHAADGAPREATERPDALGGSSRRP